MSRYQTKTNPKLQPIYIRNFLLENSSSLTTLTSHVLRSTHWCLSQSPKTLIINENTSCKEIQLIMTSPPGNILIEDTKALLDSGKYSDLTITTRTRSFKVHKAIVCTQSKVFAAMSDSGFEGTATSTFSLEDDDPATVERMITFLYTGDYDDSTDIAEEEEGEEETDAAQVCHVLMANARVYCIADKHDMAGLKEIAKANFEHVFEYKAFFCADFRNIVATIFAGTPSTDTGLRDVVSGICYSYIEWIQASEKWKEFLVDNGAIGLAIIGASVRFMDRMRGYEVDAKIGPWDN